MKRLIDADYLLKELEDWQADLDDAIAGRQLGVTDAIVIACQMPTVDAEPVRHGKWLATSLCDHVACSNCLKSYDWYTQAQYINFCPKCGAKMDGEMKEE